MFKGRSKTYLLIVVVLVTCAISSAALSRGFQLFNPETIGAGQLDKNRGGKRQRNLMMQPDANAMAHRVGARFDSDKGDTSIIDVVIKTDSRQQSVRIVRHQTRDGETVEMGGPGLSSILSWNQAEGFRAAGSRAANSDQEVMERLTFDSVDEFVLAQLRGASYQVIAENVRPSDAAEDYAGPIWKIVRVSEAHSEDDPVLWRLFFINTTTGLIDRIESEHRGARIVAEIPAWTEVNGEKMPRQIVWMSDGRTLMEYSLTNFSNSTR